MKNQKLENLTAGIRSVVGAEVIAHERTITGKDITPKNMRITSSNVEHEELSPSGSSYIIRIQVQITHPTS
jgi:hypothetical protein